MYMYNVYNFAFSHKEIHSNQALVKYCTKVLTNPRKRQVSLNHAKKRARKVLTESFFHRNFYEDFAWITEIIM